VKFVLNCVLLIHAEIGGRILYKKVLLAYDGSIEGRLALREGAQLAQFCGADVFLLAVVEPSFGATLLARQFLFSFETFRRPLVQDRRPMLRLFFRPYFDR
jgi:nucleotide-binding universal stress UspA family protein